ncbi:IS3 family transposase [Actinomadura graeca]|uniref:IS3 family transposase n=1 Tax=Actinomadura graeca TaxID=2750812 RepID=A0ABX8R7K5_9ACTN|nr:IS3 family transposase [Actinomadura graeca]
MFGVEPICRVLREHGAAIAPSAYYAARSRPPWSRAVRDEWLKAEITRVHAASYGVYGARKVWHQLRRDGCRVARCTVERLMRELGLQGARRGRCIRTTVPDDRHQRAADLLARDFTASAPNRRWVADFTHVATFAGIVYVAFVVDVFSRAIAGWAAATTKQTRLVLDALDMALWRRDRTGRPVGPGLVHHSDVGSQLGLNRLSHIDRVTGEPVRRYETTGLARCCTSMSRNSATSPTAAAGATSAASRATATERPPPAARGPQHLLRAQDRHLLCAKINDLECLALRDGL